MKATADYLLVSVLEGQGELVVDGVSYPLVKGEHFILQSDVQIWQFAGQLDILASHPNH